MNAANESVVPAQAPKRTREAWRLNKEDFTVRTVGGEIVHTAPFSPADKQDEENARLIAVAPVLFNLVSDAIDADDKGPEDWEEWNEQAKRAVELADPQGLAKSLPENPEIVEVRPVFAFEVWVRIKKSSKYYEQGLANNKPVFFKLDGFLPTRSMARMNDAYSLKFNNNSYRPEDCEFFLVDPENTKNFLRVL